MFINKEQLSMAHLFLTLTHKNKLSLTGKTLLLCLWQAGHSGTEFSKAEAICCQDYPYCKFCKVSRISADCAPSRVEFLSIEFKKKKKKSRLGKTSIWGFMSFLWFVRKFLALCFPKWNVILLGWWAWASLQKRTCLCICKPIPVL